MLRRNGHNLRINLLLFLLTFHSYVETLADSGLQRDSKTVVGKPKLDLTVGISVGLFVLFVGMAVYIYKPRKRSPRGQYISFEQAMPVWTMYKDAGWTWLELKCLHYLPLCYWQWLKRCKLTWMLMFYRSTHRF